MARRTPRPTATRSHQLEPCHGRCPHCGGPLWTAYHAHRKVTRLDGVWRLTLRICRCMTRTCPLYRRSYRPEEESGWALPHGEFGLDVIALVGALRFAEHRSVLEIHQTLLARGVQLAERTVTHLVHRYEELVALRLADATRLRDRLAEEGRVILAIDGLQPDVGHEVLWVVRDCLSGEVLLARSLLSGTQGDLTALLGEVRDALPVPVAGVISDGQSPIGTAVRAVWPGVPHQLCHFHYLREATKPIAEADRHAKVALKKHVRGVRPLERVLEGRGDAEAETIRGYCLAVRAAVTDDRRPPLDAAGLTLHDRLDAIAASIDQVEAKRGGSPSPSRSSGACCGKGWRRPPPDGRRGAAAIGGRATSPRSWTTMPTMTARRCAPWCRPTLPPCAPSATRLARSAPPPRTSLR